MAEPTPQPSRLKNVLNYEVETYFSPDEIALIQNTFRNAPRLINVIRKAMIPTISDPELPLENFGDDAFMAGRAYEQIPDSEIKSIVLGRQEAIKFICGGLVKLKVIANAKPADPVEEAFRRSKDSVK